MELWRPPNDSPHLLEWFRPLMLASRAAREAQIPWPIHPDDFVLSGRVDRSGRPPIWIYGHPEAGGELYLDPSGQPYKFTPTPNARSLGRFTECDIRTRSGRRVCPTPSSRSGTASPVPRTAAGTIRRRQRTTSLWMQPAGRVHGHLRVYDGGGSMAG